MPEAFLAAGSNLGDRPAHLTEAVRRLDSTPSVRVTAVSCIYESAPVGVTAQPDFLNLALAVMTTLTPRELLAQCLRIEAELGRVRHERWGPRTVDLDVLLYDELAISDAALTIPHPRMRERAFVLVPLAEIAPDLVIDGEPVGTLAARLGPAGLRKIGPLNWPPAKHHRDRC